MSNTYYEKIFTRDNDIAPLLLLSAVSVTLLSNFTGADGLFKPAVAT